MTVNLPELAIDAVAAYRITRLVTADVITEDLRHGIVRRAYYRADMDARGRPVGLSTSLYWDRVAGDYGPADRADGETLEDAVARDQTAPKVATLVTCRWCTGVWVAAGVVVARRLVPRAWDPIARGAAIAAAAVLVARLED